MIPPNKYLVVSVRKSDGQTFFPENPNHRKGIVNYAEAVKIAERKARQNSLDYFYAVYECKPVMSIELDTTPLKYTPYNFNLY